MKMSINLVLLHLLIICAVILRLSAAGDSGSEISWMRDAECSGSIAECMGSGEFEMESESTRRILATNNHISYGALQANNVPCSKRGASYYNCKSGGQANPYQRGCSTITRCQR